MDKHVVFPFIALCILVGVIYLTVVLISPPTPLPVDAPATEFSAGRAMQDLEVIAREPHPPRNLPHRDNVDNVDNVDKLDKLADFRTSTGPSGASRSASWPRPRRHPRAPHLRRP